MRPSKALGQHFLTDRTIVDRIVEGAQLTPESVVIEVGPGLGVLTERLVQSAGRVIAIELDTALAERLAESMRGTGNLTLLQADVLALSPDELLTIAGLALQPYQVVANLPYNIGAAVLRHFLEAEQPPQSMVVMLQKEVADAIVAAPGDLSLVGVAMQVYARTRRLFNVPSRAFYPPPKVTSSVIRLDRLDEPMVSVSERESFFTLLRAGFSAPRKQLRNSLAQGLQAEAREIASAIEVVGLAARLRPEDLSVDDWLRLWRRLEATRVA